MISREKVGFSRILMGVFFMMVLGVGILGVGGQKDVDLKDINNDETWRDKMGELYIRSLGTLNTEAADDAREKFNVGWKEADDIRRELLVDYYHKYKEEGSKADLYTGLWEGLDKDNKLMMYDIMDDKQKIDLFYSFYTKGVVDEIKDSNDRKTKFLRDLDVARQEDILELVSGRKVKGLKFTLVDKIEFKGSGDETDRVVVTTKNGGKLIMPLENLPEDDDQYPVIAMQVSEFEDSIYYQIEGTVGGYIRASDQYIQKRGGVKKGWGLVDDNSGEEIGYFNGFREPYSVFTVNKDKSIQLIGKPDYSLGIEGSFKFVVESEEFTDEFYVHHSGADVNPAFDSIGGFETKETTFTILDKEKRAYKTNGGFTSRGGKSALSVAVFGTSEQRIIDMTGNYVTNENFVNSLVALEKDGVWRVYAGDGIKDQVSFAIKGGELSNRDSYSEHPGKYRYGAKRYFRVDEGVGGVEEFSGSIKEVPRSPSIESPAGVSGEEVVGTVPPAGGNVNIQETVASEEAQSIAGVLQVLDPEFQTGEKGQFPGVQMVDSESVTFVPSPNSVLEESAKVREFLANKYGLGSLSEQEFESRFEYVRENAQGSNVYKIGDKEVAIKGGEIWEKKLTSERVLVGYTGALGRRIGRRRGVFRRRPVYRTQASAKFVPLGNVDEQATAVSRTNTISPIQKPRKPNLAPPETPPLVIDRLHSNPSGPLLTPKVDKGIDGGGGDSSSSDDSSTTSTGNTPVGSNPHIASSSVQDSGTGTIVQVYGTLRNDDTGSDNYERILQGNSELLGTSTTKGKMYSLGDYPAVVLGGDSDVEVQSFRLNPGRARATESALDRLEGLTTIGRGGIGFIKKTEIVNGNRVITYVMESDSAQIVNRQPIPEGCWSDNCRIR